MRARRPRWVTGPRARGWCSREERLRKAVRYAGGSSAVAAEHRLEPRRQRTSTKRLRHKVVSTQLENANLVILVAFGGEDHDWNVSRCRSGTELLQHPVP